MRIPLAEAEGQLAELERRAEAGDEVVLTRVGHRDIRLLPEQANPKQNREGLLELYVGNDFAQTDIGQAIWN